MLSFGGRLFVLVMPSCMIRYSITVAIADIAGVLLSYGLLQLVM